MHVCAACQIQWVDRRGSDVAAFGYHYCDHFLFTLQVNDDEAGARPVAMTVDLCKNGSTTTTTMSLEPLEPTSAAANQPAQPPLAADSKPEEKKVLYGLDDIPSWYLCIFLGFQVILCIRL